MISVNLENDLFEIIRKMTILILISNQFSKHEFDFDLKSF